MFLKSVIVLVLFLIVFIIAVALILHAIGLFKSGVPFIPVSKRVLPEILKALNLRDGAIVYDLGSGNGRVLRYLLRQNKKIKCVGIEIAPLPLLMAKIWQIFKPVTSLKFFRQDFFSVNVGEATHIFLYLFPQITDDLLPKLKRELRPGTRVVSCNFSFTQKKPTSVIIVPITKRRSHKLFVYDF